jgi:hypothetical protein
VCIVLHLPDGTVVERLSELLAEVGGEVAWKPGGEFLAGMDTCLCPVDLDHFAREHGWKLEWRRGDLYARRRLDA